MSTVATLALAPVMANAATIDLAAAGYETNGVERTISLSSGFFEGVTASFGGLTAFDGTTLSSFDSFDVTSDADYAVAFASDEFATDTVDASGAAETFLADGIVEALFTSLTSSTGVFVGSDAVLVTLTSATGLVSDGFGGFVDATEQAGSLKVEGLATLAPVPLPAGLPLMLFGLAALGIAQRSKST